MNARYEAEAMNVSLAVNASIQFETGLKMTAERLPFTIKLVRSEEELRKAVFIRHSAYGRHVPVLAELLKVPESYDREEGAVVLLAESKLDGAPLGTMRIQTNSFGKLGIERSVELPEWLQNRKLAEATRLGISEGREGRVVKTALFKALYLYCVEAGVDWMVVTARKPLDRQYEALLFKDVYPAGELIPMRHVGNIPHRVLAFDVGTAQSRWIAANHPLYNFMCGTYHPDIDIGAEDIFSSSDVPPPAWLPREMEIAA